MSKLPYKLSFVIHKHDATNLHYDFRLEVNKVTPSWAIPKGPTLDPTLKRLAMKTTDHSLEYQHFEGILPEGKYGAGPVMIWDMGNYLVEREISKGVREVIEDKKEAEKEMSEGIKKGGIKFKLFGKKLNGSFALVKTKFLGKDNTWLLIKHEDEFIKKGYNANDYDFSSVSNKSLKEIR
ncbi:3'-phosphoesterase [Candidatus Daviesbacteria bacterium]|nr:3'-phosphoesterase [Candidatus Daviesbacteria bacterium]